MDSPDRESQVSRERDYGTTDERRMRRRKGETEKITASGWRKSGKKKRSDGIRNGSPRAEIWGSWKWSGKWIRREMEDENGWMEKHIGGEQKGR